MAGTREANERDEIVRILKITNGRVAGPGRGCGPHGPQAHDPNRSHEEAGRRPAKSVMKFDNVESS